MKLRFRKSQTNRTDLIKDFSQGLIMAFKYKSEFAQYHDKGIVWIKRVMIRSLA